MSLLERMRSLSTDGGVLAILAIDHRDSLRAVVSPANPASVPAEALVEFKRDIVAGAAIAASGVMLEPEYSIPGLVPELPAGVGFFAALEAQGYGDDPYSRRTDLLDGWSVEQAVDAGAAGAKLLVFYTPDLPEAAQRQDELIKQIAEQCAHHDLPFLLEPLAYPASPEEAADPARLRSAHRRLVLETARRLTGLGATILKLQFPAVPGHDPPETWAEACSELDEIVDEPWALLSAGVDYDTFASQVEVACAAGASGFMVGRAAWGELAGLPTSRRRLVAATVVRTRVENLRAIAEAHGTPWHERPAFHP